MPKAKISGKMASLTVDVYDLTGIKKGQTSLPKSLFGVKENPTVVSQAVRAYLGNRRSALAKAKTRGEVALTKAKVWRQKGTGRARHGSRTAPLFVGGGVAHGPRGNQNYSQKISKKSRALALANVLTNKLSKKQVLVVEGLDKIEGKTKELSGVLKKLELGSRGPNLLVLDKEKKVRLAARNIETVGLTEVFSLNPYQVLRSKQIIFSKKAIDSLINRESK